MMRVFSGIYERNAITPVLKGEKILTTEPQNLKIEGTDEFIPATSSETSKKKSVWKYILGVGAAAALIIALVVEKKASNNEKAEKEAAKEAEKALKELEEKLKKEKEELENKLKEEQRKLEELLNNNSTNNNKKAPIPADNNDKRPQSKKTQPIQTHTDQDSSSVLSPVSTSGKGKNRRQTVNTNNESAKTNEIVDETISGTQRSKAELETEMMNQELIKIKQDIRGIYTSNVRNIQSNTLKNSLEQKSKIKEVLKGSNEDIVLFYSPDKKIGSALLNTSASELDYIMKSVSVTELNKNTFETKKSLLPYDNKKVVWDIFDIDNVTPKQLSDIKEFIKVVKDKSINGILIAMPDRPLTLDGFKPKKVSIDSILKEDDITQILERIIKPFAEKNVNFKNLSKELLKNADGNFYSYDSITTIARKQIMEMTDVNSNKALVLLSEKELLQLCKECKPDIAKETLENLKF